MDLAQLRHRPSNEEINALPLRSYEGPIRIIRNAAQWRMACEDLYGEKVIGFDTETRPTFRKGKANAPALIQMATSRVVHILQLNNWPFGEECAQLLADPKIIKVGVAIGDDMKALAAVHPFEAKGLVDLGALAKDNNMDSHGLRTLAASLFGWRISKGPQCSNWNARKLSSRQITYAATDAWIGRMIYLRLAELGLAP